jgi:hypothetical protein
MPGDIRNGHKARQTQNITLKGAGISPAPFCEGQFHLADHLAGQAENPLNLDLNEHGFCPDGYCPKAPQFFPSPGNLPGFAVGTSQREAVSSDAKYDGALFIAGADVFVANNAESMIQKTCGHMLPPSFLGLVAFKKGARMSTFFN